MALLHAPAEFIDQFPQGNARRGQFDAGLLDPTGDGIAPPSLAIVSSCICIPLRSPLQDVPYPVKRFHIILQRRSAKQPDFGDVGRAIPGQAALAFDGFDHCGFFATDVSPGAPAQFYVEITKQTSSVNFFQFHCYQSPHCRVFIAQVQVTGVCFHRPGSDQHAFDKPVRVLFQVKTILEGTRLAFVGVYCH